MQLQKYNNGQVYDANTGAMVEDEMAPVPFASPLVAAIMSGKTPPHLQVLFDKYPEDPDMAEAEYSEFAGVPTVNLKDKLEKAGPFEANVLGMAILPHDAFVGMDGEEHEGYWRLFVLTDIKDPDTQQNTVIVTSGTNIIQHGALAIKARGWYKWSEPVRYRFSAGSKSAHFMNRVDRKPGSVRVSEHKK